MARISILVLVCRCFADVKPRNFDRSSCVMMNSFSELVVRQLEKDVLLKVRLREIILHMQRVSVLRASIVSL